MKRILCAVLCAMFIISLTACSQDNSSSTPSSSVNTSNAGEDLSVDTENVSEGEYDLSFSKRDSDSSYDESAAVKISFTDTSVTASNSSATVNGTEVTINSEGTYLVSGSCKDGKIVVDTDSNAKVQLVLNGLNLKSSNSPVVVKNADKVFFTLAEGSENTISDGDSYEETIDDTSVDAAIFCKNDVSINGSGKLTVNGNYKHGIVSKDDLVIADGDIAVTSVLTGIEGKDSVKIKDAAVSVEAGSDGIRATNIDEIDSKGFVYINSGTLKLTSTNDAIQASSLLRVDGGNITITSGDGASNGRTHTEGNFRMKMFASSSDTEDSESAKGIKSADTVIINGGTFNIDSSDDGIHSNNMVQITNGKIQIATGDDGIHADASLTVDGGNINVTQSYEGLEAGEITINDGNISVVASDDGFNAGGGNDGNAGGDPMRGDASKKLIINGGYIFVDAYGDGLDSNGSIEVTGGTTLVSGPPNGGNGALDCGITATITGGTIIAIGSTGMAETIEGSGQCSMQTDIDSQSEGTTCAVVDSKGNVIASLTGTKTYSNVVVSTPAIKTGETYSVICGGTVNGADEHGFASSGKVSGGSLVVEVTMDSENYSNGGNTMGGGMGGNRMGGGRMDGDRMGGHKPDGPMRGFDNGDFPR